jgi:tetratricopeptide (TPR) repeat protein
MGNQNTSETQNQSHVIPSSISSSSRRFNANDGYSDEYILIWLDGNCDVNSLDALRTKTLFRNLNKNRCSFINNINLFFTEIEKIKNENKKILVVVSGAFALEIISKTNEIISAIIIFCGDDRKYKYLMGKCLNLIGICTEYETLKTCIQSELPSLKFNLFANQKLNSFRSLDVEYNNTYFSYMLFISFLKQMPSTKQAKDIMLDKCKDYYRSDKKELERIELFRDKYTPNQAIDWYVADSFVYRLVNRAFRTEDVTLWYLFRFYISDLCTQLETIHQQQNCQSILKLYRGQAHLPIKEFENLKSNIGGLTSTNAFVSASKNIDIARTFVFGGVDSADFKVVIFEITVDASNLKNIIFVDINQYMGISDYAGESEVLFNIGSVFQVEDVVYDDDLSAWKIQMKATDKSTVSIKERIEQMKTKFENGNINLLFGRLLLDMNQHIKAESYFQMMLNVLPKSHADLALVYDCIGDLKMHTTNWNEAFKNFNLAYEIKKKKLHSNPQNIGATLHSLGNYYKAIRDNNQALEYYSKVLTHKNNPYNRAITLLNMSAIYVIEKDYNQAFELCIEARDIIQESSSNAFIAVIQCHSIMGSIYLAQRDYEKAKEFYLTAVEMSERTLFIDDRSRIVCVKAVANLYHQQNMKQEAIDFCIKRLNFYEQHLTENRINIAYLFMIIAELYEEHEKERMDFLERASSILQETTHLHYDTTANCFKLLGQYHQKQNLNNNEALKFYRKTLEIQKKIYPNDHPILDETQCLINDIEN